MFQKAFLLLFCPVMLVAQEFHLESPRPLGPTTSFNTILFTDLTDEHHKDLFVCDSLGRDLVAFLDPTSSAATKETLRTIEHPDYGLAIANVNGNGQEDLILQDGPSVHSLAKRTPIATA